jgi:transcriptional regulator with XRE-family HTH domain
MTPTIPLATPTRLPKIATHATAITAPEQFDAAMQPIAVVKTPPTQPTFTWNVETASSPTQTRSLFFGVVSAHIYIVVAGKNELEKLTPRECLERRKKWRNREYRQAYMEAAIEQGIAWQIKINRDKRNLTQRELAEMIGSQQSAVSRSEDPSYGRHRLETLVKMANAFDCALRVRFVPYSALMKDSDDLSPTSLYAASYDEEVSQ